MKQNVRFFLAMLALAFTSAAPAGVTTSYAYDALGRLIATSTTGEVNNGVTKTLTYDPAGNRQTYSISAAGTAASVVVDGSFENPPQNGGYTYNPVIAGVTFGGQTGVSSNGSDWGFAAAPDGGQEAFMQGGPSPATISMNVTGLTPGVSYSVHFSLAQRPGYATMPVTVSFNGTALGTYTAGSTAFVQVTTEGFTASGTTGTITFSASSDGYHCLGIDAVSVIPVIPVVDASFESPPQNGGYIYNPSVAGATFGGQTGIASNGSAWGFAAAPDGTQEAFIQGGPTTATISTSASGLTGGAGYSVRFSLAQRPGYATMPITVSFNGVVVGTYAATSTSFTQITTASFTAPSGGAGTITFSASSDGYHCAGIDAVSVVPAP
jgi:hypothetical protein